MTRTRSPAIDSTHSTSNPVGAWAARAVCVVAVFVLLATLGHPPTLPPGTPSDLAVTAVQFDLGLKLFALAICAGFLVFSRNALRTDGSAVRDAWRSRSDAIPAFLVAFFALAALGLFAFGIVSRLATAWATGSSILNEFALLVGPIARIGIVWVFAALVLAGVGLLVVDRSPGRVPRIGETFLIGWAVVTIWLVAWHLFARIGLASWLVPALASIVGWIRYARSGGLRADARPGAWTIAALVAGALWVANRALLGPRLPDFGFYHLPAINWALAYPAVPGLGNLHGRLAFNNASLLFSAALDALWRGHSHLLAHGLLFLVATARSFAALGRFWRGESPAANLFVAAFAPILVVWSAGPFVSSHAPDASVVIASLFAAELFVSRAATGLHRPSRVVFTLVCAAGVAIKLSFAVFAAALWIFDALRTRADESPRERHWVAFALGIAILMPWIARGFVQSGYPAYPVAVAGLPVEWTMPLDMAAHDVKIIKAVARDGHRDPDAVLADDAWFRPWLARTATRRLDVTVPLALFFVGSLAALRRRAVPRGMAPLAAASLAALVNWYVMAPDPRFAAAMFWVLGAIGVLMISGSEPETPQRTGMAVGVIAGAVGILIITHVFTPGLHVGVRTLPDVKIEMKSTASGLEVVLPPDELCWNGPLLCMPRLDIRLRLRRAENLGAGFSARP
ncbi:MAG: hypothetical protein IT350_01840 [Deltaproteobacteria bacterium]|nr:hypothetical protein [Deltaproteobacteria bacterium]